MNKILHKFSMFELVIMAVIASLGIAMKVVIKPIMQIVCGPFMIPTGTLAGGFYMMWLIIGVGLIKKPGTAVVISVVQAMLVLFTGVVASQGIMSFLVYIAPGLAVELLYLVIRHDACCVGCCALGGMLANIVGVALINVIFFKAPGVYLILVLSVAALSGIIGGVLAWKLLKVFDSFYMLKKGEQGKSRWEEG